LWRRKWKTGSKEEKKEFRRRKEGRKKKRRRINRRWRRIVKGEDQKMWKKGRGGGGRGDGERIRYRAIFFFATGLAYLSSECLPV
jgi:hypothetical protein